MIIELPNLYAASGYEDDLSFNAQLYVQCPSCGFEERASPLHLTMVSPDRLQHSPCPQCQQDTRAIVRHRQQTTLSCLDCGTTARVTVVPWEQVRCPRCMSTHLEESDTAIDPPLPAVFGELGERLRLSLGKQENKEHPWGIDGAEDAGRIFAELDAVEDEPDFYRHVLAAAMFARSLVTTGDYPTGGDYNMILSGLGNLERQYFNATGELAVGLDAVGVFEDAVRVAPDDADRAASEHNVAMAINSLLIKYPEDGLEEVSGRPHLRQDAIDAASRALRLYHAATASGAAFLTGGPAITAAQQAGRVHHLLGDLIARPPAGDAETRTAIGHYDVAIGAGLPDVVERGAREARAVALTNLSAPTQAELQLAAAELQYLAS
jgi:hypothetical protein